MPSLKRKREEYPLNYVVPANDCTSVKTFEISDSTFVNRPTHRSSSVMRTLEGAYVRKKQKKQTGRKSRNLLSEKLKKADNWNKEACLLYDSCGSMWQVISVENFRKQHLSCRNMTTGVSSSPLKVSTGKNAGMFCSKDIFQGNKYFRKNHTTSEIPENTYRIVNNLSQNGKKRKIESREDCRANDKNDVLEACGRTANGNIGQEAFVNYPDNIICNSSTSEENKLNVFNPQNPFEDAHKINAANELQPHHGKKLRRKKFRNVENVNSNTFELFKFPNGSNLKNILSENGHSSNCKSQTSRVIKEDKKFAAIDRKGKQKSEIECRIVKDDKGSKKNVKSSGIMKLNCMIDENTNTKQMRKYKSIETEIEMNVNCKTPKKAKPLINDEAKEKKNIISTHSVQREEIEKECDMGCEDNENLNNGRVEDDVLKMKKGTMSKISDSDEGIYENGLIVKSTKIDEECPNFSESGDDDELLGKTRKKVKRIQIESEDEEDEQEENEGKKNRKILNDKIMDDDESSEQENNSAQEEESDFIDDDDDSVGGDENEEDENNSEIEEVMLNNKRRRRRMKAMEFLDAEAEEGEETEEEAEEEEEEETEDENDEELGVEQFIDNEAKEDMIFVKRKKKKIQVIDSDDEEEKEKEKEKQIESVNLVKTVHIMKKLTRIITFGQLKCETLRKQINKDEEIVNMSGKGESLEENIQENGSEDVKVKEDISDKIKQNEMLQNVQLSPSVNDELQLILGEGDEKLKKRRQQRMRIPERNYASDSECQRILNNY